MEKLEYFTVKPNLKQIYGRTVDKNTEFEEQTDDGRVHQTFKDLTLTTTIHNENEVGDIKISEDSTLIVDVPEGTKLLWSEFDGFFVPSSPVCTLDELKEEIEDIQNIYNGGENNVTKGNEE